MAVVDVVTSAVFVVNKPSSRTGHKLIVSVGDSFNKFVGVCLRLKNFILPAKNSFLVDDQKNP